jgi:uncharacterized protein (TIGR00255 family)
MTGFGRGSGELGEGRVVVEIKSVNHRFLEVRSRAPRELMSGEALVERVLRRRLSRGYCTVNCWYEGARGGATTVDKGALSAHLDRLIEVGEEKELVLADLIPVLAAAPDLFVTPRPEDSEQLERALREAVGEAIDALVEMREREGGAMAGDLEARLEAVSRHVEEVARLAEGWPEIALARIRERVGALLESGVEGVEPGRMEVEAAVLADRADISEEITRLRSHVKQLGSLWERDDPVGRKAEFLIQEMAREVNTVGAKASLSAISAAVVELKTELEKMRELVQNIE